MKNIAVVQRLPAKPQVSSVSRQKVRAGALHRAFLQGARGGLQAPGQTWGFNITIPQSLAFIPKHKPHKRQNFIVWMSKRELDSVRRPHQQHEMMQLPLET